ncbi:Wound-induced protein [Vigna angularis]|uniref:Wound-induced protein n=3 Tax=Phaseolus angularis TaxID=3914 RepID=A0A8T0K2X7_PHAAN|nr:Wound-induced protein [Vigna angularis]
MNGEESSGELVEDVASTVINGDERCDGNRKRRRRHEVVRKIEGTYDHQMQEDTSVLKVPLARLTPFCTLLATGTNNNGAKLLKIEAMHKKEEHYARRRGGRRPFLPYSWFVHAWRGSDLEAPWSRQSVSAAQGSFTAKRLRIAIIAAGLGTSRLLEEGFERGFIYDSKTFITDEDDKNNEEFLAQEQTKQLSYQCNCFLEKPWLHDQEDRNKRTITDLYKAITSEDTNTMHRLLAPDLEWWFHGPPSHRHHLIPHLTAATTSSSSSKPVLVPDLIVGFGSVTIAEGFDETNLVWWVHAWTTTADGVITEIREYVNTSVTVTRLGFHGSDDVVASAMCTSVWQSKLCDESVPGLILAI